MEFQLGFFLNPGRGEFGRVNPFFRGILKLPFMEKGNSLNKGDKEGVNPIGGVTKSPLLMGGSQWVFKAPKRGGGSRPKVWGRPHGFLGSC